MNPRRIAVASALIACALTTTAHAELLTASASVSLTNLTFTLIDLDPTDGIAPSISIYDTGGLPSFELRAQEATLGSNGQWTRKESFNPVNAEMFLAPGQAAVNSTTGQSLSEVTMSSVTTRASTSLDTSDPSQAFKRVALSEAVSPCCAGAFFYVKFELGTNTALRLQGDYSLMAQLNPGPTAANEANAWLQLALGQFALNEFAQVKQGGQLDASTAGSIDFTLSNDTTQTKFASFSLWSRAEAVVESRVSPIPEPSSVALLLAGLGVAAACTRRRG